jgi:hypothetical protein
LERSSLISGENKLNHPTARQTTARIEITPEWSEVSDDPLITFVLVRKF